MSNAGIFTIFGCGLRKLCNHDMTKPANVCVMNMKKVLAIVATAAFMLSAHAKEDKGKALDNGGLSAGQIETMRESFKPSVAERAIQNALASNGINALAVNRQRLVNAPGTYFSIKVPTKGITNQKQSGRCWLFTGLNVMRSDMINNLHLPAFQFSQNYNFFWDQLEKSNLFLQSVIDSAGDPLTDRRVEWLFNHPLSDGGTFMGVADIVMKYGVVPASVMPETSQSDNTSQMSRLLGLKLKEWGLRLRKMHAEGASKEAIDKEKNDMLAQVYRYLALNLGEPPVNFEWTLTDGAGKPVETNTYTPLEFYKEYVGYDLDNDFVMLMNDPSRPFWEVYEIDLDRHTYDGHNWRYVNVPMEVIKESAVASLKDSTMMYFSCDVGKFFDRERGTLDLNNYDYSSLFGMDFPMTKAERIATGASASSHAMTLAGVDLTENGKPTKWYVENSWGPGANDGHLIMTDEWMDEYLFRLVSDKKYVPQKVLDTLANKKPILLPAWDILY